ncbi:hypothetical protein T05_8153 [Trichinella murrelli]|uniref:Uncharacterized protein n=1 Tax=Trichinella murrelli TaxID=144512 RepID=A0A0V0SUQ4_9BILA|nr:hypothetical protein T05_9885 [Trichinella murrelli]KRX31862.1 hypothetical protein T05_8153 [Trichinella murrelli]
MNKREDDIVISISISRKLNNMTLPWEERAWF